MFLLNDTFMLAPIIQARETTGVLVLQSSVFSIFLLSGVAGPHPRQVSPAAGTSSSATQRASRRALTGTRATTKEMTGEFESRKSHPE